MKKRSTTFAITMLVAASALATIATPVHAQDPAPAAVPAAERRSDELATWLKQYHEWEKWYELWGNKVARNGNNLPVFQRKKRPEPPAWLAETCRTSVMVDDQLASACHILWTWDDQPAQIIQRRGSTVATSGGNAADTVVKSLFFQRVHLTGLWVRSQIPSTPVYGIIGMQIAVLEVGRMTLPATGVMLVMIPDGAGGHDWKPATTVSFGYRLFDFKAPLHKSPISLHVNVASTHIHGLGSQPFMAGRANMGFAGFSVSGKRRH
jgi:hypothetical protein